MKILLQRVKNANVNVEGVSTGHIDFGWLALIGFSSEDTNLTVEKMCNKILTLRAFSDENDKMNLSVTDAKGKILAVSQFTLYANCKKGRRPSFVDSAPPDIAEKLFEYTKKELSKTVEVQSGVFGANMEVSFTNLGPVTIMLDSNELL